MCVETLVSRGDQLAIKPFLTPAGFVAGDENDRLAECVEGEGRAPCAIRCVEAQLLHVGVFRVLQSVHVGSPELGPKLLEQSRLGEQSRLSIARKPRELFDERLMKDHDSRHWPLIAPENMPSKTFLARPVLDERVAHGI